MSQQHEALRLADALEKMPGYDLNKVYCEAAFQLRYLQRQFDCLHAENEALKANHKIVGYTTKPITWNSERHHSEQIMKITQRAQPEHGFVHPVYAVFNSGET